MFAGDQEVAAEFTEGECDPNLGPGVPVDGVSASLVSVERGDTQTTVVVKLSEPSSDPIGGLDRVG